jgi:hypothetical protein
MKKIRTFLQLSFFTLGVALFTADSHGQSIPASWQTGMTITMTYGGGMTPYTDTVFISDSGCYFAARTQGKLTKHVFILTKNELDSLAQFLRRRNFDKISEGARPVLTYDKGSTSILLQWDDHFVGAGTSASMDLEDKQQEDFYAVSNYLDQLVASHSKKKKGKR